MDNERMLHGLMVRRLEGRLRRDYKEVEVNPQGGPDIVLKSHGLTLAAVEVETEKSITPEKAEKWAEMAVSGTKLILMVPRSAKIKATDLLWQNGIMDKVAVGSYEIKIEMP
jgi:hypothetical protein